MTLSEPEESIFFPTILVASQLNIIQIYRGSYPSIFPVFVTLNKPQQLKLTQVFTL